MLLLLRIESPVFVDGMAANHHGESTYAAPLCSSLLKVRYLLDPITSIY
jgi:hypothetical protein